MTSCPVNTLDGRYFVPRRPIARLSFEEEYWGVIVDPDGAIRNRAEEREQALDDLREELEFLNRLPGGRLLDVGCGLGFLLSGLREQWKRFGVEVSRYAAERAKRWGDIFVGELADAHFPADHFNAVVLHHVIEHVADPVALIREVKRTLAPSGWLVLGTPDFDSPCARRFGERYRLLHDPTHISLFTCESMHRFLRDFGFDIRRFERPFFETRHFTRQNIDRLFDTDHVSPPFVGNFMTFYCQPAEASAAPSLGMEPSP